MVICLKAKDIKVCIVRKYVYRKANIIFLDVCDVFSIRPCEAMVQGSQSVIFEVRFDPSEERIFYCRELVARVYRLPCYVTNVEQISNELLMDIVPDFVSVRLIGKATRAQ